MQAVEPSGPDEMLLALAGEFEENDRALRDLLAGDGRDSQDVPGFDELADRQAELAGLIVARPARTLAGLSAKARCARVRSPEQGFDAALALALSVCGELIGLSGSPPSAPSAGPGGRSSPASGVRRAIDGSGRLAGRRHDGLRRHLSMILGQLGASSLVSAVALPMSGFGLPRIVAVALLATGAVAVGCSFLCLPGDGPGD